MRECERAGRRDGSTRASSRRIGAALPLLVLGFCALWGAACAQTAAAENGAGENLALGRPYALSVPPSTQWFPQLAARGRGWPDVARVLTDGRSDRRPTWSSGKGLDFRGAGVVEVEIDLGRSAEIGEIRANHHARPAVGVRLHQRDEFWVSDDGEAWFHVGTHENRWDEGAADVGAMRSGAVRMTSGPIRARGRHVLVRSFTHDPGALGLARHVSLDEVEVLGAAGVASMPRAQGRQRPSPPAAGAWQGERRDWARRIRASPLMLELWPQSMAGDDAYHLTTGLAYVIQFRSRRYARGEIGEGAFQIMLPDAIEVHDVSGGMHRLEAHRVATASGRATRYVLPLSEESVGKDGGPVFIVSVRPGSVGPELGHADWSFHYVLGKRRFDSEARRFALILDPPLARAGQGRFLAGFWLPYATGSLGDPRASVERLARGYAALGFSAANGGYASSEVRDALAAAGLENYTGANLSPNALMFGRRDPVRRRIPPEHAFEHHPSSRRSQAGICPTRFASEAYDAARTETAARILEVSDHVYENWEPYMFQKSGCICEACRESFRRFSGFSRARVDAAWPDIVIDEASAEHDDFTSSQYAAVLAKLQESVDAAAAARGRSGADYVPAISTAYFRPGSSERASHDPADWLRRLRQVLVWDYGNAVAGGGIDASQRHANHLAMLPRLEAVRSEVGRADPRPRVHFTGTESYRDWIVLPEDAYFMMVLALVEGFDGYATWTRAFKPDARFLGAQARALRQIRRHEPRLLGAAPASGVSGWIDGSPAARAGVHVRAFPGAEPEGRLVAVGNDTLEARTVVLRLEGSDAVRLRDSDSASPRPEPETGVVVPAKSWRFFELAPVPVEATASAP